MIRYSYKPDKTQPVMYQYRATSLPFACSNRFNSTTCILQVDDSCCMIVYPVPMICVSPFWQSDDPLKVCSALKG